MNKLLIILLFIPCFAYGQTYYVATDGDDEAAGTIEAPWATASYAATQMAAGDTVYFRGGTYYPSQRINITRDYGSGSEGNITCYFAYPGEVVIFDFINYTQTPNEAGNTYASAIYILQCGFTHWKNITIRNVLQKALYTTVSTVRVYEGYNNTFENIIVHNCGGQGFMHETLYPESLYPYPYDTTRYINCDAYNLCDTTQNTPGGGWRAGNYSDGFKTYGGNDSIVVQYINCRAWNCSDDGWDNGGGMRITFQNCWSFLNGHSFEGDGNGFKLGAHRDSLLNIEDPIIDILTNCITAFNQIPGYFWLEYEPYWRIQGRMWNCISYNDGGAGVSTSNNIYEGRENIKWQIRNSIFWNDNADPENASGWKTVSQAYKAYTESHNNWDYIGGYPGWAWTDTVTFTPSGDWLVSDSATIVAQLTAPRQSDGSLPYISAFRLAEGSDLIGMGKNIGMSETPDIGIDWAYYDAGNPAQDETGTDILSFTFPQQNRGAVINYTNHTVSIQVVKGTNVTSLTPTITLSPEATISPTSGTARNFTTPQTYTVTAGDAVTTQVWTVTVTVATVADNPVRGYGLKLEKYLKHKNKLIIVTQ